MFKQNKNASGTAGGRWVRLNMLKHCKNSQQILSLSVHLERMREEQNSLKCELRIL